MTRAKKIFPFAVLDTRAIGSTAPVYIYIFLWNLQNWSRFEKNGIINTQYTPRDKVRMLFPFYIPPSIRHTPSGSRTWRLIEINW